jgi:CheY-like chemotaxis protein
VTTWGRRNIDHSDQTNHPGRPWHPKAPTGSIPEALLVSLHGSPPYGFEAGLPRFGVGEGEPKPVRVLVVDDHPAFRKALASALRLVGDIEVAGEASGGEDACIGAKELQPDVVLMDLSMPDISGIESMQRIHSSTPDLPVVILTAHADEGVERAARGAGASGFVAKGKGLQDILLVLHEVTAAAT